MLDLGTLWQPTPKQALAQSCPVYEVMYGGAKGGGKSDWLLMDHVKQHRVVHEHFEKTGRKSRGRALIVRKEFGRLKDMINRAWSLVPVLTQGRMRWKDNDHMWYCECGYRLEFGHVEGPQDHQLYQGQEFSWLGVDQVEEIPYDQYTFIKLQVRTSEDLLKPLLAVRLTANPLGRHADWVKRRFVDPDRAGLKVVVETIETDRGDVVRDRVFIPATLRDNPHLPKEYEAELMAAPEHLRRAFLDGDWDVTPGSFFGDVFDPKLHVIDDLGPTEIRIPSNWPVFRCGDWGVRNPAACYWIAVDNDGLLIVLDELYGPGEESTRWAKKILAVEEKWGWTDVREGMPPISKLEGYLDPSAFASHDGPPPSEKMFEVGVNWFPADNERKAGWAELRRRLLERGGAGGKIPGLRIARRCTDLIRTLPNLTSPENETGGDMDDIDTRQEDHACFVPSTNILTPRGVVKLESLVGTRGEVIGPDGPEPYSWCGLSRRQSPTVFVDFSDGDTVQCTPDHRFLSEEGVWIRADAMIRGQSFTLAASGGELRGTGETEVVASFTEKSGAGKLALFRLATTSTIATATVTTIGWRIWSAYLARLISGSIRMIRGASRFARTLFARRERLASPLPSLAYAPIAVNLSRPGSLTAPGSVFAQPSASPWISTDARPGRFALALSAASKSEGSQDQGRAQLAATGAGGPCVVSVRPGPRADVYCLTVPRSAMFALGNGVLVHNCDAVRYGCMSRPMSRTRDELADAEIKRWERIYLGQQARASSSGRNVTTGY